MCKLYCAGVFTTTRQSVLSGRCKICLFGPSWNDPKLLMKCQNLVTNWLCHWCHFMVSCVVSNHSHDSVFLCCSSTDSQGFNAIIILTTQGPFPRIIHGARSTRGPRSKARLPNVAYGADDKICSRFHIFAHRSLVFDLVTRRDLAHQEWSIVERDSACLALEKHKQRWSPFFFFFFFFFEFCHAAEGNCFLFSAFSCRGVWTCACLQNWEPGVSEPSKTLGA